MIICGLKLTHDGAVALVDDGRLIFSIETEKLNNNPRYAEFSDLSEIPLILEKYGYALDDIDQFVIDGWEGLEASSVQAINLGASVTIPVAPYRETSLSENLLQPGCQGSFYIGSVSKAYSSYMHVTGHILGAYCSSAFAKALRSSYVLVWDGGMFPRLYYFDVQKRSVENLGKLFYLLGNFYEQFALYYKPFSSVRDQRKSHLDIAGKVMAYIAKGNVREDILQDMNDIYASKLDIHVDFVHEFAKMMKSVGLRKKYRDEDVLASAHVFIENALIRELGNKLQKYPKAERNLCMAGGCSLNIKWNSAIRNSGLFNDIWVPPFPNDSGSAIGAACAEMVQRQNSAVLEWNVYAGPALQHSAEVSGWKSRPFALRDLAQHLHEEGEPVIFLNKNAEVGPRALGNRSILAPATNPAMKQILNRVKHREDYRPVAPICLESFSHEVFSPGGMDAYMVFEHDVREQWLEKVPAICHLDKTARVQTINEAQNPDVFRLLHEYHSLSGIPLLCNTSANLNGRGFFPDVKSAMEWGKLNYVWCDNILYEKQIKEVLLPIVPA